MPGYTPGDADDPNRWVTYDDIVKLFRFYQFDDPQAIQWAGSRSPGDASGEDADTRIKRIVEQIRTGKRTWHDVVRSVAHLSHFGLVGGDVNFISGPNALLPGDVNLSDLRGTTPVLDVTGSTDPGPLISSKPPVSPPAPPDPAKDPGPVGVAVAVSAGANDRPQPNLRWYATVTAVATTTDKTVSAVLVGDTTTIFIRPDNKVPTVGQTIVVEFYDNGLISIPGVLGGF